MADSTDLYGHPFRAIWQQLAGDLGITTGRMHDIQIDQAAQQAQTLQSTNVALAQAMQGADPEQSAQLAQVMRDRAQLASSNIAAIQQGKAPQPLASASEIVSPFYSAREQQRIGAETTENSRLYDLTKQAHDEYHKGLMDTQGAIDKVNQQADTLLAQASDKGLGSDDKIVQGGFRRLLGSNASDLTAGDVKGGEGPINRILEAFLSGTDTKVYSADEINKGVAQWRLGQLGTLQQQKTALQKSALAHGFQLDEGGGLADLHAPDYKAPTSPQASGPGVPTPPPGTTVVPPPTRTPQDERATIAEGATVGGTLGHFLLHGLVNRASAALTGAEAGRLAGPIGALGGAVLGAVAPEVIAHASDTLDDRLHQVAGPNIFEDANGQVVDQKGAPVYLPPGLKAQVVRRSRARQAQIQRPQN